MTSSSLTHHATPLPPGTTAPDFELPSTPDQKVSLFEFRGQPVILAFYPEDWSPVCSDQMALYQEVLPEFQKFNAELLGISVDGIWSHLAFAKDRTSEGALYVIDADGIVQWSYVSPVSVNPGADGILRALENLAKKGAS